MIIGINLFNLRGPLKLNKLLKICFRNQRVLLPKGAIFSKKSALRSLEVCRTISKKEESKSLRKLASLRSDFINDPQC